MKTLKAVFADELKIEFVKTRKEYIIGYENKSLPHLKNFGSKPPKVGMKAGKCSDGKMIQLFEYKGTRLGWSLLKEFAPSVVEVTPQKIFYKTQSKFIHKDIVKSKKSCTMFFEDASTFVCSPDDALSFMFEGKKPENITEHTTLSSSEKLLNTPDHKLSPEQLAEKMRIEESMGLCPFEI